MAREDLHFRLRIPDELKAKVQKAADANHRSMTAEIVARLEITFQEFGEYNAVGVSALSRRLEANIEAAEKFAHKLLYELRAAGGGIGGKDAVISEAVEKYAAEHNLNKAHAVQAILEDWLACHGFLTSETRDPSAPEGIRQHLTELEQSGHILPGDASAPGAIQPDDKPIDRLPSVIVRKTDKGG